MKKLKISLSFLLCLGTVVLCYQITKNALENQRRQNDYAEINDIKYGLFSINQWKAKLSTIITQEITRLNISTDDKKQIKPLVEKQLDTLIDAVHQKIKDSNEKSFKGKVKQAFIDTFVDIDEIKAGIPGYADEMIKVLEKPRTKNEIKGMILDKVGDYFEKTFEEQDLSRIHEIVARTGTPDPAAARAKLAEDIEAARKHIYLLTWIMIGLATAVFLIASTSRQDLPSLEYVFMIVVLLALLATGVGTPMINLEAKITEMSFILFDHPVQFLDQVLYFQSKSVLDVFWIMITHQDLQMKVVGILLVAFSVVFPLLKITSSILYFYDVGKTRTNALVRFFVLKSGKWSMTDVLVIAIFMAYIGFNGVISSQFDKIHSTDSEIVLLTTNGTALQPGFYLFFAYAVLALFLSEFLTRPGMKTASQAA